MYAICASLTSSRFGTNWLYPAAVITGDDRNLACLEVSLKRRSVAGFQHYKLSVCSHPCANCDLRGPSDTYGTVPVGINSREWIIPHIRIQVQTLRIVHLGIGNRLFFCAPVRAQEASHRTAVIPRFEVVVARFGVAFFAGTTGWGKTHASCTRCESRHKHLALRRTSRSPSSAGPHMPGLPYPLPIRNFNIRSMLVNSRQQLIDVLETEMTKRDVDSGI